MNTGYIQGQNLLIYTSGLTGWEPIGYSTSLKVDLTTDSIEVSNKNTGNWKDFMPTKHSFSASVDAMVTYDKGYWEMVQSQFDKEIFKIKFAGRTDSLTDINEESGDYYFEGYCFITSSSLTAGNGDVATYSINLQGKGALERKVVS